MMKELAIEIEVGEERPSLPFSLVSLLPPSVSVMVLDGDEKRFFEGEYGCPKWRLCLAIFFIGLIPDFLLGEDVS